MDEVAAEALVSRATAYRYFASVEALLVEAPIDSAVGDPETMFVNDESTDVEARIDAAEAALHRVSYENEAQLRVMLAHTVVRDTAAKGAPVRQNRRIPLIEAALGPLRTRLKPAEFRRLCSALAVYFGTESMIVFRDVLRVDEVEARKVKSWAVKALVRAALAEAADRKR
jgi:AcrR family transcriptional regulator